MLSHSKSIPFLATCKYVWAKCILLTSSRILGYMGKETKTALHLCLGLWPSKFCSCADNIVLAQKLACCALELKTGSGFASLLAIADYLTSL